ncbi:possible activator of photopigment and puc with BLUF domain [Fulvimarina pelagi HTCC2506]|uniref:Possible activator of photopigment and puc with BLUF domain n=1 Tax=Fulvimarina pelagi HTCC2506 TaxID=314231 RepID=Q0G5H1_9HYPH|nr:BLUF domain-containing protein [Fulvimarina pelagi]EAU43093.1 possible activator of photopigment and puc with BLUF domain [Fulvimarina pelagi HTCC2506]
MPESHYNSLHRLLYTSKSRFSCSEAHVPVEIKGIVAKSFEKNRHRDLTGVLLFINDTFIQVLEGPLSEIETAFEAICCDMRHGNLKLVDMTPVETRIFDEWSMAFVGFDVDPSHLRTNRDLQEVYTIVESDPEKALRQIRGLIN